MANEPSGPPHKQTYDEWAGNAVESAPIPPPGRLAQSEPPKTKWSFTPQQVAWALALAIGLGALGGWKLLGNAVTPTPPPVVIVDPPVVITKGPVKLPKDFEVPLGRLKELTAECTGEVAWFLPDLVGLDVKVTGKVLTLVGVKTGSYWIGANTVLEGKATDPAYCKVQVKGAEPPVPVDPPVPDPKPKPPEPKPEPPPPIPQMGLRVLVVYETMDFHKLPRAQQNLILSSTLREWLDARVVKGPDGKSPEWRFIDKDTPAPGESQLWKDALARPRTAIPWLIISNGTTGVEGPLPVSEEEFKSLVTKFIPTK